MSIYKKNILVLLEVLHWYSEGNARKCKKTALELVVEKRSFKSLREIGFGKTIILAYLFGWSKNSVLKCTGNGACVCVGGGGGGGGRGERGEGGKGGTGGGGGTGAGASNASGYGGLGDSHRVGTASTKTSTFVAF